ncbi:MAG: tRNA (adenosine(37)-N6)-dimethylallyltransferase MiaA [Bacilli bacterium]|nr:tRNA (adenosine(37)-N6)-dimethylallyltransferase MiaA [Bacilli bacterium]
MQRKKVIAIVGPTCTGKTKLSVELAKHFNGEIINGDSTQIYKGMDIATAKVTEEEKEGIPHHLFDHKDWEEDYTVYDYQKNCREKISEIQGRGNIPIIVGGTGLYIKAALYDYKFNEKTSIIEEPKEKTDILYQRLLEVDPTTNIHPNNRKRIVRALSYFEETGHKPSEKEKTETELYDVLWIGLQADREVLYKKINERVDKMIEKGLLEEAKYVYESGIRTKAVLTPIGYKELFPYFAGESSLEVCLDKMKQNSRKYAKRQYTWFNGQVKVTWFPVVYEDFEKTIYTVENFLKQELS